MSNHQPRGRGRGRGRVVPMHVLQAAVAARGRGRGGPPSDPPRVTIPIPRAPAVVHAELTSQFINNILGTWVPHPLSNAERDAIRRESGQSLGNLVKLQAGRPNDVSPADYATKLQEAEIDYKVRSFRLFRVNDLLPEILSNILRFVVWSASSPDVGIQWRLQLTWVCRHWRHAVISDSTLWNAIWFRDSPPFTRSLAFLERSGNSPLDLRINDSPEKPYTDADVRPVLDALTPHLHHIRMLIVLFDNWEPILSVLQWLADYGQRSMRNECVPLSMERIEIHRTGSPYTWPGLPYNREGDIFRPEGHTVTVYPLFGGASVPTLVSFTLNGLYVNWDESPSISNLNTLDIRRIPFDKCPPLPRFREILASSPRLTKLSLDGAGPGGNPASFSQLNLPAVDLPLLNTLVLANFAAQFTSGIVSHFNAPNVKDLTIMNFKGDGYGPFYQFATGRFPNVRILTLYTTSCAAHVIISMIRWLDSMPMLAYLRCAAVAHDVFQTFLFEPDMLKPHPALVAELKTAFHMIDNPPPLDLTATLTPSPARNENQPPRAVSPKLAILEVQSVAPEMLAHFLAARKMVGAPIEKVYMARTMLPTFTAPLLNYVRNQVPEVLVVDVGAKTSEEEELLR